MPRPLPTPSLDLSTNSSRRVPHVHILGICGTFMGGLAALARELGWRVTGNDSNVYPPMSEQLQRLGIELIEGWQAQQLALKPDLWVVGNVARRGLPLVEALLNEDVPLLSGPQWLAEYVLRGRHVAAVAGTHGKTTTSAMLAWVLDQARPQVDADGGHGAPGFLIGGVPLDFGCSARLGDTRADTRAPFVVEADEYDTAFFDKRSKFVHYRPRTLALNNLEFDHADIFPDLGAIETQFHHLIRTVPGNGNIVLPAQEATLERVLARGCWTPVERFACAAGEPAPSGAEHHATAPRWLAVTQSDAGDQHFVVYRDGVPVGEVRWQLLGAHNRHNALAAIACAAHLGVPPALACAALGRFQGVARRMQLLGEARGVRVFDDFAHHPTAMATTLAGARRRWPQQRLVAVFEPRSNTMKQGAIKQLLPDSLAAADLAFCFAGGLEWDAHALFAPMQGKVRVCDDLGQLRADLLAQLRAGDQLIFMSNGGFGGIQRAVLQALQDGQN